MTVPSDIFGKQRADAKLAAAIATESATTLSKEWSGVEELDTRQLAFPLLFEQQLSDALDAGLAMVDGRRLAASGGRRRLGGDGRGGLDPTDGLWI